MNNDKLRKILDKHKVYIYSRFEQKDLKPTLSGHTF